jgi:hypothetical protein
MTTNPAGERAQDRRYVVLLLRLLVDHRGRLIQGEIGSMEDGHDVAHWVCFRGPGGLPGAVEASLPRGRGRPG